jgi:hypothetical protein
MEAKIITFLGVERLFKNEMRYYPEWLKGTFNICCDETERRDIIQTADIIKSIPEFSILSFSDIYLVLIFVYYSLNLNEQSTDWLTIQFLSNNAEDEELCKELYLKITTGDIMINGSNLSSKLRRKIMGMPGGRKTKRNRRKRNRRKRNKTKKYKFKKNIR